MTVFHASVLLLIIVVDFRLVDAQIAPPGLQPFRIPY